MRPAWLSIPKVLISWNNVKVICVIFILNLVKVLIQVVFPVITDCALRPLVEKVFKIIQPVISWRNQTLLIVAVSCLCSKQISYLLLGCGVVSCWVQVRILVWVRSALVGRKILSLCRNKRDLNLHQTFLMIYFKVCKLHLIVEMLMIYLSWKIII